MRLLCLLALLPALLGGGIAPTAHLSRAATGTLLLDDEFNGTSLDTTTWTALNRPGDASNSEQECYLPSNATVAGGSLTLTDRVDASCTGFSYTSAMIIPKSFNFTYGTFEVRAQMPSGTGQWPALWLLGANCQATFPTTADNSGTCQWPVPGSNEIDLFETINTQATSGWFSLNTGTAPNNDNQFVSCSQVGLSVNTHTGYHVYDLIWQPGSLTWQIDGQTYCAMTQHVPTTPMFPILNVAVGGSFPGQTIDTSVMPQTMNVDYVRVYGGSAPPPTSTPIPSATPTGAPGTATPIPTAAPPPAGILGSTLTSGGQWDGGGDNNDLDGNKVTTGPSGGALTSLSAYVGNIDPTSKAYGLAIYSDSGGFPGTLVASATGTLSAQGWNTLPLSATLAPNTAYWLVYNTATSDPARNVLYLTQGPQGNGDWSPPVACCVFPVSQSGWTAWSNLWSITATLGGTPPPTSTASATRTPIPPTATPTSTPTPANTATQTSTPPPSATGTPTLIPLHRTPCTAQLVTGGPFVSGFCTGGFQTS